MARSKKKIKRIVLITNNNILSTIYLIQISGNQSTVQREQLKTITSPILHHCCLHLALFWGHLQLATLWYRQIRSRGLSNKLQLRLLVGWLDDPDVHLRLLRRRLGRSSLYYHRELFGRPPLRESESASRLKSRRDHVRNGSVRKSTAARVYLHWSGWAKSAQRARPTVSTARIPSPK